MNGNTFFKTACSAIITLLLLSGCNNDVDNGLVTSIHMRDKFNQTEDTFAPGDEINMTLSIKNDSTSEKTLSFSDNYQYDFVIKDATETEIWRWSTTGLAPKDIATSISLGPTDIQTVTYTWDQNITPKTLATENDPEIPAVPISEGNYTLEAYFIDYGPVAQTPLTIQ